MGPIPQDLMALLGGGGGEAPAPEPAGPPMGGGDNVQFLEAALEELQGYISGEDDEQNKQLALQCLAKLQSILANEEKEQDNMLQGKVSPRALRRAAPGGESY